MIEIVLNRPTLSKWDDSMNYVVCSHLADLAVGIGVTAWVARTLSVAGRAFLVDSFLGKPVRRSG